MSEAGGQGQVPEGAQGKMEALDFVLEAGGVFGGCFAGKRQGQNGRLG